MASQTDALDATRHSYDQFLLALKIESGFNVFGALGVAVAFYILSDRVHLLAWFTASAVAFALGAMTAVIAYLLVSRARERLGSGQGGSGSAAPDADAEERTRTMAAIFAFVSMSLFSIGSSLPILGWFWY